MGRIEGGTLQVPVTMYVVPEPALPGAAGEYAVSVLRVIARKDVGEPLTGDEREAARLALHLLGRDWR